MIKYDKGNDEETILLIEIKKFAFFYLLSTVICVQENIDYIYTYCANTHNPHLYSTKFVTLASVTISITKIKVKAPLGKQSTSKVTYQQYFTAILIFHCNNNFLQWIFTAAVYLIDHGLKL